HRCRTLRRSALVAARPPGLRRLRLAELRLVRRRHTQDASRALHDLGVWLGRRAPQTSRTRADALSAGAELRATAVWDLPGLVRHHLLERSCEAAFRSAWQDLPRLAQLRACHSLSVQPPRVASAARTAGRHGRAACTPLAIRRFRIQRILDAITSAGRSN